MANCPNCRQGSPYLKGCHHADLDCSDSLNFHGHKITPYQPPKPFSADAMATTVYVPPNDATSMRNPDNTPRAWATEHDWTKHRALITQLYELNKLPEVMEIMESQHDFRGTTKMYKTHIRKWGLDKKNKEPEMRAMVRKNKQRADQGKGSSFRVRNRDLEFAEIVRYWERKGVSIDDVIARSRASPTPEAVECFTPVPSPIMTPHELAIPERVLLTIRDYFTASFESGVWVKTGPSEVCHSIKDKNTFYRPMEDVMFNTLFTLFWWTHPEKKIHSLLCADPDIEIMILAEQPFTLVALFFMLSCHLLWYPYEESLSLIQQFHALIRKLLGDNHPIGRITAWLASVQASQCQRFNFSCVESMADHFETFLGPFHTSTFDCRLHLLCLLSLLDRESENQDIVLKLWKKWELELEAYDYQTSAVRNWVMNFLRRYGPRSSKSDNSYSPIAEDFK